MSELDDAQAALDAAYDNLTHAEDAYRDALDRVARAKEAAVE